MRKEYLEAFRDILGILSAVSGCEVDMNSEKIKTVKSALRRLESIDNANPSEALEKLEKIKNYAKSDLDSIPQYFYDLCVKKNKEIDNIVETIKQVLIKAQEQEELLKSGDLSDGYHTFNQLYYQRCVLFASLVRLNKNKSWKSFKHSDGKYCFDSNGEWFIVGIDTPIGSYTYHYEKKYWDLFECQELECGKEWDGHTEEDVTRLLSLPNEQEKVLEIIKKKQVDIRWITENNPTREEYNAYMWVKGYCFDTLEQEEYDLLKRWLKC